jgi:hypothetical protein
MLKPFTKSLQILLFSVISFFLFSLGFSFAAMNSVANIPSDYKVIGTPVGITVMSNGDIWFSDPLNNRIVKINQSGQQLMTLGKLGSSEGQFNYPMGMTHDNQGNIYVVDANNSRVQKFDSNGAFLMTFGTYGSGDGELWGPQDIQYDSYSDSILVVDSANNRVVKFSKSGTYLSKFGSLGRANGQLDNPVGITTDVNGRIYIVEFNENAPRNSRVSVFSSSFAFIRKFGTYTSPDNSPVELFTPRDIVVLADGSALVSDSRIKRYDSNGNYIESLTDFDFSYGLALDSSANLYVAERIDMGIYKVSSVDGTVLYSYVNSGNLGSKMYKPDGVAVDSLHNVYTYDENSILRKYDSNGDFVWASNQVEFYGQSLDIDSQDRIFITSVLTGEISVYDTDANFLFSFGGFGDTGTGNGEFNVPAWNNYLDVAFDTVGNIYVGDPLNFRVQKFDSNGNFLSQFGSQGTGDGEFSGVRGIATDSFNNVYVVDANIDLYAGGVDGTVEKFSPSGDFISRFSLGTTTEPMYLAIDGNRLYATADSNTVIVTDLSGNLIETMNTAGSDINQFFFEVWQATTIAVDNTTHLVYVSDKYNHRIEVLTSGNVRIKNLMPGLDVKRMSDGMSLVQNVFDPEEVGIDNIDAGLYFGDTLISRFTVNLTEDRDWSNVVGSIVLGDYKTVLANLNPVDAPGISAVHSIYTVKSDFQTGVFICPTATQISEVNRDCAGGYSLENGNVSLLSESLDGKEYWRVDGVTGTGALGLSYIVPQGPLTLTPNSSPVATIQQVNIEYTSGLGFVSGDKIQFHFEPGAGFDLGTCGFSLPGTPTTDANGDAIDDGVGESVDSGTGFDIFEYTFTDSIAAGPLSFCVEVESPGIAGSYSVRLTDDNGTFDNAMYYVGDDNDVFVIANVAPSLSFNIRTLDDSSDTNVCQFGTVSSSDTLPNYDNVDDGASECGYALAIGTNAASGFQAQLTSDGALRSTSAEIANIADGGTFSSGVEAYGLANIYSASTGRNNVTGQYDRVITRDGSFNLATDTATNIPVGPINFVSFTNGIQYLSGNGSNDVTDVVHGLVIGSGTPAGYYQQVLTYTVTANF